MITADFTTTAYGITLSGTTEAFGWTPDEQTEATLSSMEPSKAHRAMLRCKRAASKAFEQACRQS